MSDETPFGNSPPRVALIGGAGRMGRMFRPLFEADGCAVLIADEAAGHESPEAVVPRADVVLVTVPIRETVPLIRRIAPLLRADQLLTDFTSIKTEPVKEMLETPAAVIGCHPIFGPMANPAGQNVAMCPARPGRFLPWYRAFFERHGMSVVLLTPEAHDQAMAFIQGLTHFINIAFATTLRETGADLESLLQVCSPVYRVFFAVLSRILSGDPQLYGQIQLDNPANTEVVRAFLDNGAALLSLVENQDARGFDELFREAADYLGDYKYVARQDSEFLIEQMRRYLLQRDPPTPEDT